MKRRPWFKFWPQDWAGDRKLHGCSLAARGLWLELMCLMHEGDPYGHLACSVEATARSIGASVGEVLSLTAELEAAGVLSRTRSGTVFSRRMVRDESTRSAGVRSARKRWPDKGTCDQPNGVATGDPHGHSDGSPWPLASLQSSGLGSSSVVVSSSGVGAPIGASPLVPKKRPRRPKPVWRGEIPLGGPSLEAWKRWRDYEAEKGYPVLQTAGDALLVWLAARGTKQADAAIDYSIRTNQRGVIEEPPPRFSGYRPQPKTESRQSWMNESEPPSR